MVPDPFPGALSSRGCEGRIELTRIVLTWIGVTHAWLWGDVRRQCRDPKREAGAGQGAAAAPLPAQGFGMMTAQAVPGTVPG